MAPPLTTVVIKVYPMRLQLENDTTRDLFFAWLTEKRKAGGDVK